MNFAELRFWGLLLAGLGIILMLRATVGRLSPAMLPRFDKVALVALGLTLLLCVSWVTLIIFLCVAIGTYVGLRWIQEHHPRHAFKYLLLLIPLQLLPLAVFKYADFVGNGVLRLDIAAVRGLVIPVGISFYTFQKIAFVVDTLALQRPLPRFLDYMNFAAFFPQIVAGPIERRADLLPQMEQFRWRWQPQLINEGAGWIAVGLFFKCCLADNLAAYFNRADAANPYLIWLANVLFGLRIYYDFAGYSLIAVGVARCLGVRLTLNFLSPYCANSIGEFWRRWHVTLSQWFRDYLYLPLGGHRTALWFVNIGVVFVVSGIWHGAGWNFILWGALHAAFLIASRLASRLTLPRPFNWTLTMAVVFFAWLPFYELQTSMLVEKLRVLLMPNTYSAAALRSAVETIPQGDRIVVAGLLVLTAVTLALEWWSVRQTNEPYRYLRKPWVLVTLVVLTVLLAPGKENGFIYFAF